MRLRARPYSDSLVVHPLNARCLGTKQPGTSEKRDASLRMGYPPSQTMNLEVYTGGLFDTNSFFLPDAGILIDAPQGVSEWLGEKGFKVTTLLLTHGHIDHVWDAARVQREHGCKLGYHVDGERMITEREFFKSFGYAWEIEPSTPGFHI